jgi:putative peptide zinc metalloprotease protein
VSAPGTLARPTAGLAQFGGASQPAAAAAATPVKLSPGKHLAVAMVPVGGATRVHPALFVIRGGSGKSPVAILSTSAPDPSGVPTASSAGTTSTAPTSAPAPSSPTAAQAFPFALPKPPGPGGTQALATNTTDGGVVYDVAYALVTVSGGANVTNTNSAFALAHCKACTTVAVSFQLVLIVGSSHIIAPINAAGALNYNCPACVTTALADQIVVTLKAQPSQQLLDTLNADLKQLDALPTLGAAGTPAAVASEVATVQKEIDSALQGSGLETNPPSSTSTSTSATPTTPTTPTAPSATTPSTTPTAPPTSTSTSTTTSTTPSSTSSTSSASTTASTTPSTTSTDTTSTTSTTP